MKRYVIPAIVVVDAVNVDVAVRMAGEMTSCANRSRFSRDGVAVMLLDEEMKDKVMDIPESEDEELPHTYNDFKLKLVEDVEGKPYLVDVSRTSVAMRTIRVIAKNAKEAELKAIEGACNVDYGTGDQAEYRAETVTVEGSKKTH